MAPYLSDLAPPKKREGVGNSSLTITTSSPEAQAYFNRGLSLLHCFWELEAYRNFLEVVRLDPDCAMGYWGICMSLPGKTIEAQGPRTNALASARRLGPTTSAHEQLYIEGIGALIEGGPPAYIPILRRINEQYPDDLDAKAWLAYFVQNGYLAGTTIRNRGQSEALRLLDEGLKKAPDHLALHHYRIHVLESGPEFLLAKTNAERLLEIAPNSAHLLHMPGHLFFLSGDYARARDAFIASDQFDTDYLKAEGLPAYDHPHYLHNLHYLALCQAELGQKQQALATARRYRDIALDPNRDKPEGRFQQLYEGRAMETKVAMRFADWGAALQALEPINPDDRTSGCLGADQYHEALRTYLRGRIACAAGEQEAARATIKAIETLGRQMIQTPKTFQVSSQGLYHKKALQYIDVLLHELKLCASSPAGGRVSALWTGRAAEIEAKIGYQEPPVTARPALFTTGEVFLAHERWTDAIDAFTSTLKSRPNSPWANVSLARAYRGAGNMAAAQQSYRNALAVWSDQADPDLPELLEATSGAAE